VSALSNEAAPLNLFQKSLKYGLPDRLSISCYEAGFADRVIAQQLRDVVQAEGYSFPYFSQALTLHRERIAATLAFYPTYFETVLEGFV